MAVYATSHAHMCYGIHLAHGTDNSEGADSRLDGVNPWFDILDAFVRLTLEPLPVDSLQATAYETALAQGSDGEEDLFQAVRAGMRLELPTLKRARFWNEEQADDDDGEAQSETAMRELDEYQWSLEANCYGNFDPAMADLEAAVRKVLGTFGPAFDDAVQLTLLLSTSRLFNRGCDMDMFLVLKSKSTKSILDDGGEPKTSLSWGFDPIIPHPAITHYAFDKVMRTLGLVAKEPKFMLVHALNNGF
jgi:hypothetical protein